MYDTRNNQPAHERIYSNPSFANYFTNCKGAIDATHVSAKVAPEIKCHIEIESVVYLNPLSIFRTHSGTMGGITSF